MAVECVYCVTTPETDLAILKLHIHLTLYVIQQFCSKIYVRNKSSLSRQVGIEENGNVSSHESKPEIQNV